MANSRLTKLELKERLYERRYVFPNAVTVGNLFCGFLAVIYASTERFEKAVIAIIIAILLDGLDGRVARRLNATSKFGVEFDSFSDLVSFGVAPALLMYYWCFQVRADEFGVFVCFVYALCGACRLARFNISEENLSGFEGLASPAAAGFVAAVVYVMPVAEQGTPLVLLGTGVMAIASYLMISQIPYFSIKKLRFEALNIPSIVGLGSLIALTWYLPRTGFLTLTTLYLASGPFMKIVKSRQKLPPKKLDQNIPDAS